MPIFTVGLPDGREVDIEAPEGASEEQAIAYVKQQWDAGAFKVVQPSAPQQQNETPRTKDLTSGLIGLGETGLTVGSGLLGNLAGGLAGLAVTPFEGAQGGAETVESVRNALTYQPKTESGQAIMRGLSGPLNAIEQGQQALGNAALDATGSPLAATAAYAAPDIIGILTGLKTMRPGTPLKQNGMPTRELRDALNQYGVVYESLDPKVQAAIPDMAPRTILGTSGAGRAAESAVSKELRTGGRQGGLAPYTAAGESVVKDAVAGEALRQGFDEGLVQMVKTATPKTREAMGGMLKIMERTKKDYGINLRPTDIAGNAVARRVEFLADKARSARNELNTIADQKLAGRAIDPQPIVDRLFQALDDLDVSYSTAAGKPTLDFRGSIIQADKSSQRAINSLLDLMSTGGAPDALRFHKLKRQLDALIDFSKKSTVGLTESGRNVLKSIRYELNQQLRQMDPDYARVNDVISEVLGVFNELDAATASKIDIFGDPRALGGEFRKMFTNYQNRVHIDNAMKNLDTVTAKMNKGELFPDRIGDATPEMDFSDSVYEMSRFAEALNKRFGNVAPGGMEGIIQKGVQFGSDASTQGMTSATTQAMFRGLRNKANELRNIDDYNAYRAMEELLR